MLTGLGHAAKLLSDGDEIDGELRRAAAAGEAPYDVLLLDIVMTRTNGVDVARALVARGVPFPVVAMTANATPDDLVVCACATRACARACAPPSRHHRLLPPLPRSPDARNGFADCLAKPFDREELRAVVERAWLRTQGKGLGAAGGRSGLGSASWLSTSAPGAPLLPARGANGTHAV
jgi:CheY-like chemotaxis protein